MEGETFERFRELVADHERHPAFVVHCSRRNALARAVFFNRLGESRDRSYEDQMNRAGGLALLTAAIALWNAAHLPAAVAELRRRGEDIPDEQLGHLSPLG